MSRGHDHPPAYGPLRLGIEMLGLFEKWHERNFGTHADEQEQEKLRHQGEVDDREIHEEPAVSLVEGSGCGHNSR